MIETLVWIFIGAVALVCAWMVLWLFCSAVDDRE